MNHKNELFELFDWMTEQDNLFFDYFNWASCFIGWFEKQFNICFSSRIECLEYFNLTSEQFVEIFCNIKLSDDTAHNLQFHIERIKTYIEENNL